MTLFRFGAGVFALFIAPQPLTAPIGAKTVAVTQPPL